MKTCQPILFVGYKDKARAIAKLLVEHNYRLFAIDQDSPYFDDVEEGILFAASSENQISFIEDILLVFFDCDEDQIEKWLNENSGFTFENCVFASLNIIPKSKIYTWNMSLNAQREFIPLEVKMENQKIMDMQIYPLLENSMNAKMLMHQIIGTIKNDIQ